MELSAIITSLIKKPDGSALITFRVPAWQATDAAMEQLQKLQRFNLNLVIKRFRDKRSLNANALLWKCIGSLAEILNATPEEIYLKALNDYGQQVILAVVPEAEQMLRASFRAVVPMGQYVYCGQTMASYRCTIGSSQYDTAQMSRLLSGVIDDCKELGGFVPDERQIMTGLEIWKQMRKESVSSAEETATGIR